MLDPRGEEAQTGSSQWREWDKAWNSAKGACLLWQEFRSYHRAGRPIVWASLFATFLAMKKVEGELQKKENRVGGFFAHPFVFLTPCPVILNQPKDLVILQKAVKGKSV